MRITGTKIIKALQDGWYITSPKFPKNVYLRLVNGDMELIDWGQTMNCQDFIYSNFIGLMKDNTFYICDKTGEKMKNEKEGV